MKILKLNKSQSADLLTLCKEFFPEARCYNGFDVEDQLCFRIKNKEIWLHWYQLCLTELPERIWSKLNNKFHYDRKLDGDFLENYTDFNIRVSLLMKLNIIDSVHPVDFLYDFVKECKKNKYFKK